jgi:hypothetical protein
VFSPAAQNRTRNLWGDHASIYLKDADGIPNESVMACIRSTCIPILLREASPDP